jgi:hypothetical protein
MFCCFGSRVTRVAPIDIIALKHEANENEIRSNCETRLGVEQYVHATEVETLTSMLEDLKEDSRLLRETAFSLGSKLKKAKTQIDNLEEYASALEAQVKALREENAALNNIARGV